MTTLMVRETAAKPRHLYIVATDRRDLYDLFRIQFADDPNVEVILDRRKGARRAARGATAGKRRRAERRQMEQEHLLKTLGVVLVSREHRGGAARERHAPVPSAKGSQITPSALRRSSSCSPRESHSR